MNCPTSPQNYQAQIDALIKANHSAPADSVIRALFRNGSQIRDEEDGAIMHNITEALEMWYSVDMLVLSVLVPIDGKPRRLSVALIHQDRYDRPGVEDISDYHTSLEKVPEIARALDPDRYPAQYQ